MDEKDKRIKVMAAMSGGVDSSVAAYLLKRSGYDVSGVTMCFGIKDSKNNNQPGKKDITKCCGMESIEDSQKVCTKLGISHYVFDFSDEMKNFIIKPFIRMYLEGKTPNPCIECNKFLKFSFLLDKAMALGFDYIATGHYAGITEINKSFYLKKAADTKKDQTYFLYGLKKEKLEKILFPLEKFTKEEVRKIARDQKLPVAEKAESQEICFIPNDDYRTLIKESSKKLAGKPGNIVDPNGRIIGKHKGIQNYTIGQRKGIRISAFWPLYVLEIDNIKNQITVGERGLLKKKNLKTQNLNLFCSVLPEKVKAKIRYKHEEAGCQIIILNENMLEVVFDEPQIAITPGQSIVFYENDVVLGGGVIVS